MKVKCILAAVFLAGAASADIGAIDTATQHANAGSVVFNSCGTCHTTGTPDVLSHVPTLIHGSDVTPADLSSYLAN